MTGPTSSFYTTLAQILPVLLLALIWDSAYLTRLSHQRRPLRRDDPAGIWFWTKPRVRAYILTVTGATVVSIATIMVVLAGLIPDSFSLRIVLLAGLALLLVTIAVRIAVDVIRATSTARLPSEPDQAADATSLATEDKLPGDAPAT